MKVTRIRHAWPEQKGFFLERPRGAGEYILLHFWQPMHLLCGGEMLITKPDACIIFSPDTPQKFYNDTHDMVHDWIHITGDAAEALDSYGLRPDRIYYPENCGFITEIVREMETEFFACNLYYERLLDTKLHELFAKISRHVVQKCTGVLVDPAVAESLKALRQSLFSSLEEEISVPQMARRVGLSESRFYVLYKSLFGIAPMHDIIYARIERAKNLLSARTYSVSEVAKLAGYTNEYHFIRQFKKVAGVTPGQYMR